MKTGKEHIVATVDLSHARWRKSSRSSNQGNCVEVAFGGQVVAARDSKDPEGGALTFTEARWASFLGGIRRGHFG